MWSLTASAKTSRARRRSAHTSPREGTGQEGTGSWPEVAPNGSTCVDCADTPARRLDVSTSGFQLGHSGDGRVAGAHYDYERASSEIQRVHRIDEICRGHGITLADAAIQFPLAHPIVASVVIGRGGCGRQVSRSRNCAPAPLVKIERHSWSVR